MSSTERQPQPGPEDTNRHEADGRRGEDIHGREGNSTEEITGLPENVADETTASQADRAFQARQTIEAQHEASEDKPEHDLPRSKEKRVEGIRKLIEDSLENGNGSRDSVKILSRDMIPLRFRQRFKHISFRDKGKSIDRRLRKEPLGEAELKALSQAQSKIKKIPGIKIEVPDTSDETDTQEETGRQEETKDQEETKKEIKKKGLVIVDGGIYENFQEISRDGGRKVELAVDESSFKDFSELEPEELGQIEAVLVSDLIKQSKGSVKDIETKFDDSSAKVDDMKRQRARIETELQEMEQMMEGADLHSIPTDIRFRFIKLREAKERTDQKIKQVGKISWQLRGGRKKARTRFESLTKMAQDLAQHDPDVAKAIKDAMKKAKIDLDIKIEEDTTRSDDERATREDIEFGDTVEQWEKGRQPKPLPRLFEKTGKSVVKWRRNRAIARTKKHIDAALRHREGTKAHARAVKKARGSGHRAEELQNKLTGREINVNPEDLSQQETAVLQQAEQNKPVLDHDSRFTEQVKGALKGLYVSIEEGAADDTKGVSLSAKITGYEGTDKTGKHIISYVDENKNPGFATLNEFRFSEEHKKLFKKATGVDIDSLL